MRKPHFKYEDKQGGIVCGIDEVGRGPLAGPVVAAAVIIHREKIPHKILRLINDSKKVPPEKRAYLFEALPEFAHVSIAESSVEEIDTINIYHAALLAMKRAYEQLCTRIGFHPCAALVDGNRAPALPCRTQAIVDGDTFSLSIAAASIMAKHHRDLLMRQHALAHPHYGWDTNVGYSTKKHLNAIDMHGITYLHRKSFGPVKRLLTTFP